MPEQNKSSIDAAAASLQQAISSGNGGPDVMKIIAQVEAQLNQLRTAQKAQNETITTLGERSKSLREVEAQSEKTQQQIAAQQQSFEQERSQWEAERTELQERLHQAERNVGELIAQIELTTQEAGSKSDAIKEAREETAALKSKLQAQEKVLRDTNKKLVEFESIQREASESSEKLEMAEKALAERTTQLAATQQKLEEAGKKLTEFAKVLSEQTPQLEKGAAAITMVQQQQEQIERLTKQVAEQTLRSNPEEMQRRDKRIEELTEALRQARGQSAGQQGVAEVELRNAELTAEVDQLKLELQNAQLGAEQLQKQLEGRVSAQSSTIVQDASMAEHAAKIASLTAQLEHFQSKAAADLKSQLDAQSKRHKQELAQTHSSDTTQVKQLRQKAEELEKELRSAKAAAKSGAGSGAGASGGAPADSGKLREQAERISAVAEHLRLRRARLAKARQLMRKKKAQSADGTPSERMQVESLMQIEKEKKQLYELRKVLAAAERKMIRKWAAPKAVVTAGSIGLLVVVCAAASWLLVNQLYPARISATVALEPRNTSHSDLTTEQQDSWKQWHVEELHDPEFHKAVATRMAEHQIMQYADAAAVAGRLRDDLAIDAQQPGMLVLTLAGTDDDEVSDFLDIVTAAYVAESNRNMNTHSDSAWAVATTERREEGQIHYCNLNSTPIRDDRFNRVLPIFGGMFIVTLALIVIAYTQFRKAKRVFDDENAALFTDAKLTQA